jgi:hypothetical protein
MDRKGIRCEVLEWNRLAQDRDQWRVSKRQLLRKDFSLLRNVGHSGHTEPDAGAAGPTHAGHFHLLSDSRSKRSTFTCPPFAKNSR